MNVPSTLRRTALALLASAALPAAAQSTPAGGTYELRMLTPETALVAARAALESCRRQNYQVAVAVVDRAGILQVLLRDRFAGPHTVDIATQKAWTAASFRTDTTSLAAETQPGRPMSGLRGYPRFMAAGGGMVVQGGGSILGAIGVSGGPGGDADDSCAKAGLAAIKDAVEF
jgi:uncharacterized protein GlcG (DUF336 family)